MQHTDVLILGGGIAGAAAALAAAAAGADTTLVRGAPGATALCAGGWTTAPPAPLRRLLAQAGLELVTVRGTLPHPDGRAVAAETAPSSHARAALGSRPDDAQMDGPTLVCGIDGVPSYRAAALAQLWAAAAGLPRALEHASIALDATPPGGWSPASLAAYLERQPESLAVPLSALVAQRGAARVILPAVLGIDEHERVRAALEAACGGAAVGEALGSAPSLPGWRLDRTLLRALAAAGVTIVEGRASRPEAHEGAIRSISVATRRGEQTLAASAVVLATGKFIGGGISAENQFAEPALGCNVVPRRFGLTLDSPASTLILTDPARHEPQPVLELGVETNDASQPLTESGDVAWSNVFVAGSVRAGSRTAELGLGAAADEGWSAGARAASIAAEG